MFLTDLKAFNKGFCRFAANALDIIQFRMKGMLGPLVPMERDGVAVDFILYLCKNME